MRVPGRWRRLPPGVLGDRRYGVMVIYRESGSKPAQATAAAPPAQPPAISSSVVTVVQLRAVAVMPSPLPASPFHSFERATPSGCQA